MDQFELNNEFNYNGNLNLKTYHQPQLSINSINSINSSNSIIEPVTPPNHYNYERERFDNSIARNNIACGGNSGSTTATAAMGMAVNSTPSAGNTVTSKHFEDIDKEYLSTINKVPLNQLKNEILKLSKDQYGCRFLQKKIDENLIPNYSIRFSNFEIIFGEINNNLYELIIDPFGNYLIQKLIKYCSNEDLNLILENLSSNLFQISINQHGTRALQKIIENLNLNNNHQLNLLISGLKPFIIELIKDLNGNHVIQKILNKFKPLQCQFIYDSILNNLYVIATHKHGCCVLQKCLNHVTKFQLNQFVNEILADHNFNKLINDQFGNYVLQYLISINSYKIHMSFFNKLIKFNLVNYCNLKFSSNVIEKFLKNCYNNESSSVDSIHFVNLKFDLIGKILINNQLLNKLINDPYGNYVIQTLIDHLVNPQVNYFNIQPTKLLALVDPLPANNELIKYAIIERYFNNCRIISSFGKRIQSKINVISNNSNNLINNQNYHNFDDSSFSNQNQNQTQNQNQNQNYNYNQSKNCHTPTNSITSFESTNFNSFEPSNFSNRSNSYPKIHSRSNSLQYNYYMDNSLSSNMNNLNLNYSYTPLSTPISTPISTPNPNNYYNQPPNLNNQNLSIPLQNNIQGLGVNGINQNSLPSKDQLNPNYQSYLKTPQIFANAPNDYDTNQIYYR
ncbi:hypothetical protein CLIB1444_02S06810 [[Candida] jaroonii]|uniref:Uncharacterized protein n=1 Tax=[Candida] jaroonii TaxID=467808 RepID=A0ACA9Y362_9ASCO|nr:hypothetical protein CLIB1444_02S06810 [[Candida] jaroonii]